MKKRFSEHLTEQMKYALREKHSARNAKKDNEDRVFANYWNALTDIHEKAVKDDCDEDCLDGLTEEAATAGKTKDKALEAARSGAGRRRKSRRKRKSRKSRRKSRKSRRRRKSKKTKRRRRRRRRK